jgi:outer membrane protein insertion porin family
MTTSLGYVYERVKLVDPVDANIQIEFQEDKTQYNRSHPKIGFRFDNSAPMFDQNRGVNIMATYFHEGLLDSHSDFNFTKLIVDARHYRRLPAGVLAVRGKVGRIASNDDDGIVPTEERFFAGGSISVRGWRRQQLGPKASDGTPLGGLSLLEGNVEWRFTLADRVGALGALVGAAFVDFGNVWLQEDHYSLNDLRYATGVAVGIMSPLGPVQLAFARPIFDEEKVWQWHFNIGHAF